VTPHGSIGRGVAEATPHAAADFAGPTSFFAGAC
jgi:hypothetical protein